MKRLVLALLSPLSFSIFLAALAAGCGGEPVGSPGLSFNACEPLQVALAPALTSTQSQGVTEALDMWNRLAGTKLTASATVASGSEGVSRVPLVFQAAAPTFHGLYDPQAGMVFINEDLTTVPPLRVTVAHELGHVFGLPHVPASVRASLMNSGNTTVEATPEDADALAAIWGRCTH